MKYKALTATPLESGDIIAVAYQDRFLIGIFRSYGKAGNTQYFHATNFKDAAELEDYLKQYKRVYVCYINTNADGRVIKLSKESFSEQEWKKLDEIRHILFQYKQLK